MPVTTSVTVPGLTVEAFAVLRSEGVVTRFNLITPTGTDCGVHAVDAIDALRDITGCRHKDAANTIVGLGDAALAARNIDRHLIASQLDAMGSVR